ncbi:MAG: hypothetical protein ACRD4R_09520 [Candidatus Acidiferrales bacterium]
MLWILRLALLIACFILVSRAFRQVRKPSGSSGRRVVKAMNRSHSALTDWGLQQVTVPKNAAILHVGCGGGR